VAVRVTLVLGAGGVTGGSFHAGVLAALAERGWDPAGAELIVGTSAGAISGTMLRAGVPAVDLLARLTGGPYTPAGERLLGGLPPPVSPPRFGRPRRRGTVGTDAMVRLIEGIVGQRWPERPLWIVAVRALTGRRVVFGRDGAPAASPGLAAASSAAVPGLFRPVEVDGVAHVDGGVRSVHSLDLVAGRPADLVVVSAPMAQRSPTPSWRPSSVVAAGVRAQLTHERRLVERAGGSVVVIAPDDDTRRVMGVDAMDPSRRRAVAEHVHGWCAGELDAGRGPAEQLAPLFGAR
jgi:NTE family protein